MLLTDTLLRLKNGIFKRIWTKYLGSSGIVEPFHSPFFNCHLQINLPCVPLSQQMLCSLCPCFCLSLPYHIYTPIDVNTSTHIVLKTGVHRHTLRKHTKTSCLSDWNSWNKHVKTSALRGCNQILSTTNTIEERIWWTDGKSGSWRRAAWYEPDFGLPSFII